MEVNTTRLSIKADKDGISVHIPQVMPVDDICRRLRKRFSENAGAFRKSGTVPVSFKGGELTHEQSGMIIDFLNSIEGLNVCFVKREEPMAHTCRQGRTLLCLPDVQREQTVLYGGSDAVCAGQMYADVRPYIFRGDIHRKQTLEIKGNVIILGNVARDAVVISGRSIIVVGELAGTAIAGRVTGNRAFISATDMNPKMLKIGRTSCICPEIRRGFAPLSAVATNDNNAISITYI